MSQKLFWLFGAACLVLAQGPAPKAGVCPLPILPALPTLTDTAFYAKVDVPHGKVEQATYKNYNAVDKRMHLYLPPDYAGNARYPVLYLNHGGGGDDSNWSSVDPKRGGNAQFILDNLLVAGKAKPMIIVMPNTSACANYTPSAPGKDDACTEEYLKDIIPYVDSHYRTKANRGACAKLAAGKHRPTAMPEVIINPSFIRYRLPVGFRLL